STCLKHKDDPMPPIATDPLIAAAVVVATACTDAVYVLFTNAVLRRRRLPAASWSSIWYLLFLVRRHQLPAALELRAVRGGGLVHRRLCHHHLSPSRPRPIRPSRQVPRRRELSLVIAHLHLSFPSPLVFSGP